MIVWGAVRTVVVAAGGRVIGAGFNCRYGRQAEDRPPATCGNRTDHCATANCRVISIGVTAANGGRRMSSGDTGTELRAWLERFAGYVRARDFDGARPMIAADVVSFGTRANIVEGRDALIAQQWKQIWPTIEGFTFDLDVLHWGAAGDLAWAVATWESRGFQPDGTPFPRPGRATFTFARRGGQWLATHTHFSLFPTPPG